MKLSYNNRDDLLKRLPNLKLSYENIHKKVSSELYFLIPKGNKHLVWFTYFEDKRVCIFIELALGTQKSIKDMYIVPQLFDKKMVLGTIFYGTLFTVNENKFFSVESIHYYRGKNVENNDEQFKLGLLRNIFDNELKQSIITNRGIGIGLPIIERSFDNAISCAKQLPYEIYSIQNRDFHSKTSLYNSTLYKTALLNESLPISNDSVPISNDSVPISNDSVPKNENRNYGNSNYGNSNYGNSNYGNSNYGNKIFSVKPDVQNDVYHLYVKNENNTENNNSLELFDIAAIPDYKTSVMMNRLFRNIKENENLDALEESDDESEFENMNDDKFVNLDKCVKMECMYNKKFDKYIPLKVVIQGNIVSKQQVNIKKSLHGVNSTNTYPSSKSSQFDKTKQYTRSKY